MNARELGVFRVYQIDLSVFNKCDSLAFMENDGMRPTLYSKLELQISRYKFLAWTLVTLGLLAAAWGCLIVYHDTQKDLTLLAKLSSLGSYLQGAVGSLWALAGLMFIYVAFLGQKLQLAIQSDEIKQQDNQFKAQQEGNQRQAFESSFFHLLNLHNQNVSQMWSSDDEENVYSGRVCFSLWYNDEFKPQYINWVMEQQSTNPNPVDVKTAIDYYLRFYRRRQAYLAHYFRTLYHVFKFIKFSDRTEAEKRRYASLARAQLSANELAFLFYNGLCDFGSKFKPLIEEFGILEHIDTKKLLHASHVESYDPKAFK